MTLSSAKFLLVAGVILSLTACDQSRPTEDTKAETSTATQSDKMTTEDMKSADLSAETAEYTKWVEGQIDALLTDTEKFVNYLKAGKLDEAKALYPKVRMYYERSEPIAEIFGDLDPRIDNREADLEQGEVWTGFHHIEKILWTTNSTKGTEELGDKLIADIKQLREKIPTATITGDEMVEGSVDLLNEISTSKITGEEEIFSKTDLYDFKANIEGAEKIFTILKPKLNAKKPELVKTIEDNFSAVHMLLDKHKVGNEDYKPYTELTADDTKELAQAVNKLGEPLAQMGEIVK